MEEKKLMPGRRNFDKSDFLLWLSALVREEVSEVKISAPDEMTVTDFLGNKFRVKVKKCKNN